jgi:hypothetical protein
MAPARRSLLKRHMVIICRSDIKISSKWTLKIIRRDPIEPRLMGKSDCPGQFSISFMEIDKNPCIFWAIYRFICVS